MIVYKRWEKRRKDRLGYTLVAVFDGYFLFGFIPMFTRQRCDWTKV